MVPPAVLVLGFSQAGEALRGRGMVGSYAEADTPSSVSGSLLHHFPLATPTAAARKAAPSATPSDSPPAVSARAPASNGTRALPCRVDRCESANSRCPLLRWQQGPRVIHDRRCDGQERATEQQP